MASLYILQRIVSLDFLHFFSGAPQILFIFLTLSLFSYGDILSVDFFLTFSGAKVFKADDKVLLKFSTMSFKEQSCDSNDLIILENPASALLSRNLFWAKNSLLVSVEIRLASEGQKLLLCLLTRCQCLTLLLLLSLKCYHADEWLHFHVGWVQSCPEKFQVPGTETSSECLGGCGAEGQIKGEQYRLSACVRCPLHLSKHSCLCMASKGHDIGSYQVICIQWCLDEPHQV